MLIVDGYKVFEFFYGIGRTGDLDAWLKRELLEQGWIPKSIAALHKGQDGEVELVGYAILAERRHDPSRPPA